MEGAVGVEGDVAWGGNEGGEGGLEAHEEVLSRGEDVGEEVDGAFDLGMCEEVVLWVNGGKGWGGGRGNLLFQEMPWESPLRLV